MVTKPMLNKFLHLKKKVHLLKADIHFLKECKHNKVYPSFIKINCSVTNYRSRNATKRAKDMWLCNERKYLHSKLQNIELELYSLHLKIAKSTQQNYCDIVAENQINYYGYEDWKEYLEKVDVIVKRAVTVKKLALNKKLKHLINVESSNKEDDPKVKIVDNYVHNLSTKQFTSDELQLLNKGLNFTPFPKYPDIETTIAHIETSIKYQSDIVKANIRNEVKPILREALCIKYKQENISNIIKQLKQKEVYYLKADKGNSLVILDKEEYNLRLEQTILDAKFKLINRNPLARITKDFQHLILKISNEFQIPTWQLKVHNPQLPRLYALPKIHKPGNSMRPIVSCINSPSYKVAKWLVSEFSNIPAPPNLTIKNSFDLSSKIEKITLEDDEILVSFDIVSLYPNIPIPEALQCIDEWLNGSDLSDGKAVIYSEAVRMCMEQNEFQYNNKFYKITHGTSMGNPLSCFIANSFIGMLETKLKSEGKLPKVWYRYVDDVFTILKRENIQSMIKILNSQFKTIKFTVELECDGKLPFLDLLLTRIDNHIDIDIYRKPTTTKRFITSDSHTPLSHQMATFHSMVYRMCRLPLSAANFMREKNTIKEIACINGYRSDIVDNLTIKHSRNLKKNNLSTMFVKNNIEKVYRRYTFNFIPNISEKLKPIFYKNNIEMVFNNDNKLHRKLGTPKDKIDNMNKSGIYKIECGGCSDLYIGQTRRNIRTRYKEHISHIKYNRENKSAVAFHTLNNNHLNIDSMSIELVKQVNHYSDLDAWESIFMKKYENRLMNNEQAPISSHLFNIRR